MQSVKTLDFPATGEHWPRGETTRCAPASQPSLEDFAKVYRAHYSFVWRCMRRFGVPVTEADDAAQEVFLRLYRRRDQLDARSLRGLLFVAARRVASDLHRRAEACSRNERDMLPVAAPDDVLPDTVLGYRQAAGVLQEFMHSLDEDKRRIFELSEIEECSAAEIAQALGLPLGTVYSRRRAIRQRLEATLGRLRAQEQRTVPLTRREVLRHVQDNQPQPSQRKIKHQWALLCIQLDIPGAPSPAVDTALYIKKSLGLWGKLVVGVAVGGVVLTGSPSTMPLDSTAASATAVVTTTVDDEQLHQTVPPQTPAPLEPKQVLPTISTEAHTHHKPTKRQISPIRPHKRTPRSPSSARSRSKTRAPKPREPATKATAPATHHFSPVSAPGEGRLAEELKLMTKARTSLAGHHPKQALDWLALHTRRFPKGHLVTERITVEVAALCAAGQPSVAARRREELRHHRPGMERHPLIERHCPIEPAQAQPAPDR